MLRRKQEEHRQIKYPVTQDYLRVKVEHQISALCNVLRIKLKHQVSALQAQQRHATHRMHITHNSKQMTATTPSRTLTKKKAHVQQLRQSNQIALHATRTPQCLRSLSPQMCRQQASFQPLTVGDLIAATLRSSRGYHVRLHADD